MDKPARKSKTIWFNIVTIIVTFAGIYNVEFLQELLNTPDKQIMAAVLMQGLGNIVLRYLTNSGVKLPNLKALLPTLVICMVVGIVACNKSDIVKVQNVWSFVKPALSATTEIAADWCEDGTIISVVPAAAETCTDMIALEQPSLDALDVIDGAIPVVARVFSYFTDETEPTQAQRVKAIRNAYNRMSPQLQQDIAIALQQSSGPLYYGPRIEVTHARLRIAPAANRNLARTR